MQYEWKNRQTNREILSQQIEKFFNKNNFTTETQKENTHFKILATPTKKTGIKEKIEIEIQSTKDGFAVDLKTIEKAQTSVKLGLLSSFFLGGSLLLRSLRSKEELDKLQNKFWLHVQEYVSTLQK